ncbi:MAG TPA: MFS transporter [Rhizomicrobium sp.]|nr:MFS transporter [Rhizomicrobium sp.]
MTDRTHDGAAHSAATSAHTTAIPWPIRKSVLLLTAIYTANFLDRQIINILAEPIKRDLDLSDTQLGLLTGIAFAAIYAALLLPAARLTEHFHRPRLLGVAVIAWSACTALCGVVNSFFYLVLARIGVGIGEATCTPTAHSLISDYVPLHQRASAISLYSLGVPLGALLGMAVGGIVVDAYGWRQAFLIAGLPGVVLGLLAFAFLPEPRAAKHSIVAAQVVPPLRTVLAELSQKRSFLWLMVASCLVGVVSFGQQAFMASYFLRAHGAALTHWGTVIQDASGISLGPIALVGIFYGVSAGLFAMAGIHVGGKLADRFGAKDLKAMMTIPAWACLLSIPLFLGVIFVSSAALAISLMAAHAFSMGLTLAPKSTSILGLVGVRSRATAASLPLFASTLVGLGFGPLLVGMLSDVYAQLGDANQIDGLRHALATLYALMLPGAVALFAASRHYRREFVG